MALLPFFLLKSLVSWSALGKSSLVVSIGPIGEWDSLHCVANGKCYESSVMPLPLLCDWFLGPQMTRRDFVVVMGSMS